MVKIEASIRDLYSIDFKVNFLLDENSKESNFNINTWIFLPSEVDINTSTYSQEQFFADVKSKISFFTPPIAFNDLLTSGTIPIVDLEKAISSLKDSSTKENSSETKQQYELELKLFLAVFRRSIQRTAESFLICDKSVKRSLLDQYVVSLNEIRNYVRSVLKSSVFEGYEELKEINEFADEFLAYSIIKYSFEVLDNVAEHKDALSSEYTALVSLLLSEKEYMQNAGIESLVLNDRKLNQRLLYRYHLLNNFIESDLMLKSTRKKDGNGLLVQQIYYSIAAGISMIVATAITFNYQQKFGNFTMPLFVALVIGYMLKDRIKELMRYYFAGKIDGKYYDHRTDISLQEEKIGFIKEAFDFIADEKVPEEIKVIRKRSKLLISDNKLNGEQVILYRKRVYLKNENVFKGKIKFYKGVTGALRFNLSAMMQRMEYPIAKVYTFGQDIMNKPQAFYIDKVYYINFIMQIKYADKCEYKRFRLVCHRMGIVRIEEDLRG